MFSKSKKLIIGLCLSFLPGVQPVLAESVSPMIDTDSEIEITVTDSKWVTDSTVSLKFDVKNGGAEKNKYKISVDIMDKDGKRVAGYSGGKTLDSGKSFPVKFSTSSVEKDDFGTLRISVKDYDTKTIYVSPNGDDAGFGTVTSPIKSVSRAVSLINGYDSKGEYENVEVVFADGEYNVMSTQNLNNFENLESVTLKAEGDDAVFSGGITINSKDLEKVIDESVLSMFPESSKDKIYYVNLSDYGYTADFKYDSKLGNPLYTALYNNGEEQIMTRYPESGYNTSTASWSEQSATGLSFTSDTEIPEWKYTENAWVGGFFMYTWDLGYGQIDKINDDKISVKYYFGGIAEDDSNVDKTNKKWFAFNLPDELDKPGEYVIYNNVLYFYPDGNLADMNLKLNTSKNDMISVFDCENVTIEGITFENSRGYFVNVGNDTKNVNVLGCDFRMNSENAVIVDGTNNYNNTVKSCNFYKIGARPVLIGGGDRTTLTSSGNLLENCYFNDFNIIERTNCAAVRLAGCGVTMKKNTITGAPHLAMSYGGNNHIIEYNDIFNCLTDGAGDAGIIYAGRNLSNLGTEFKNNYIHDSYSGMGAIYYDDWLSGQKAVHNVFENLDTILFVHAGVCNEFSDNYISNSTEKEYAVRVRGRSPGNHWKTSKAYDAGHYLLRELITLPWQGELWQNSYGNVLKYVNKKYTTSPSETVIDKNYFINVKTPVVLAEQAYSWDVSGENYSEINAEKLSEYSEVKNLSGIYSDSYRTVQ